MSRPFATLIRSGPRFGALLLNLLGWLPCLSVIALTSHANELAKQLQPLIDGHRGEVAVAVKNLRSGAQFVHRAETPMPTASLIKFPLMVATYAAIAEGELNPDQMITLDESDKVPGSGILTPHFSAGTQLSLRDAIQLMIAYSDNTATNLVIDQVGLPATAKLMEQLGCPNTKLHSKVFRRDTSIFPERSVEFGLGSTTAAEQVKLLEMLQAGELVDESTGKIMLQHLYDCQDRSKLPRHLPTDAKMAHKGGSISASRCDAGIMETPAGPIAVCVLTTKNKDHSWGDDNEAEVLCGEIGRVVYHHFNPTGEALAPTIARVLKIGADGPLVESLQRTLNARLEPSPKLGVDGDFGPATEAAVVRFQKEHGLPDNGQVGPDLWRQLGPLVTSDDPVPDPEVVNAARLEKLPPDPLTGVPFVTCPAWAILDAKTGELLWGENETVARDPASTTKIMTAYMVTSLAAADPSVLAETMTFSRRADDTSGSTSGIRAGEQVTVDQALYGLMLPSGNDASVALGEHFGHRLRPADADQDQPTDPYEDFVAAMNRTAQELGMSQTSYRNTHGLTAEGHVTSALDLARLAWTAMQQPTFQRLAATPRYGCKIGSQTGYERNVVWTNSNRLLQTAGYDGVKTGTTGAAGACLASRGTRGDDSLIVVVLGSKSSDARYVDTRNLFRWAWLQLGHEADVSAKLSVREPIVLTDRARELHRATLVVDGHNDMPWELRKAGSPTFTKLDIAEPQAELQTDIPRLREGGVGAQFWSVWVPADTAYDGTALAKTLEQIELVQSMMSRYPHVFELARTSDDITRIYESGRIASLIGVEGGHCIENSLNVLHRLYDLGARYMTLTHSDSIDWADSGTDEERNGGLTDFGRDVVREMNRMGMMVDISHVSVKTMHDVLDVTTAPVIFSHSSARAVADHPRNVPDDVLTRVAQNGGIVMINFFSGFVVPAATEIYGQRLEKWRELQEEMDDRAAIRLELNRWQKRHPMPRGTIHDVLDHIDHVVRVAGVDHVGLGSDYDGVSVLPTQMDDVSCYPLITQGLLDRGYRESDIRKILGENMLRVFRTAEEAAEGETEAEDGRP